MSPRRSSRARTTQPRQSDPPANSTSTSSVSSGRTDRATRSNIKQSSPQKSSTPHSLSSEEVEEPIADPPVEPPQTRRRAREQDNDEDDSAKLDDELDDDIAEEEEITRCVCGQQDYPGPPSDAGKSRDGQSSGLADSETLAEDAGGLFIQCDVCKVWQHGGCVGIMDEAASPEEYFCEDCRKDLHKLMTSPKGQRYSRYLPVSGYNPSKGSRKSSVSKDPEPKGSRDKEKSSRASAESFTKRRSTMNSRAAWDEDEVLRKVLEASKGEGSVEGGNRKKRSRDDSEDIKQEPKRQRTGSRSPTTSPTLESDDEGPASKNTANGRQKPRGAAARSQREKELREKEKERERAEAAGRRKGRIERRRADELETAEQTPIDDSAAPPSASESVAPDTPSIAPQPAPTHKKSGRPPQKRVSRLGRNQYTRDRDSNIAAANNGASPSRTNNDNSPRSPQTSAVNGTSGTNGHDSSDGAIGGGGSVTKHPKAKNWRLEKMSWNDIRRPAGVMQNYISQRQVELAGVNGEKSPLRPVVLEVNGTRTGGEKERDKEMREVDMRGGEEGGVDGFKRLSTLQMMDDLSRELVLWQRMVQESQAEK
ncbi:hypothetical protein BU16DRAFT_551607 [Lophium mytilinum]|uniref:Zinc finger PHD-type domain-containing protein n=1 Tax=Lophium mytilinum TaxID=390894 RepID=A0A6A6QKN7_9PEZI|nr:hypothetical protein BU16DRAFT_551607 [Lophium mytilinum]